MTDYRPYAFLRALFNFQPVDHSRDTFERLVEKFPTSGRYWKMYIDHEVSETSSPLSILWKLVLFLSDGVGVCKMG